MRRFLCTLLLAAASAVRAETLGLDECLREVALHNPLLEVERTKMQASLGVRLTLRARALPRLGFGFQAGQQGDEGTSFNRSGTVEDDDGKKVAFTEQRIDRGSRYLAIGVGAFTQPLFDAAIPATWRRSEIEITAAEQNFLTVAVAQLHQARTLFYTAMYARESGRVYGEVGGRLDANTAVVGDLVKAGVIGRQSLLQARLQRSAYELPRLAATGSYETTLAALWALMGRETAPGGRSDPLRDIHLAGSLADARPPHFDAAATGAAALDRRPDLRNFRALIRASAEDARILRGGYYPLVQILISGQALPQNFVRSERPNALRAGDEISTTEIRFGGRFSWNVIDTGAIQGSARRIDRLREALEINLRDLEQSVPRDLARLRAQCDNLAQQGDTYRANAAAAADTLGIVTAAVKGGTSSQLEVIDAENGALNTEIGLLNVQLQSCVAQAEFDRITGGYVRLVAAERHDKDR